MHRYITLLSDSENCSGISVYSNNCSVFLRYYCVLHTGAFTHPMLGVKYPSILNFTLDKCSEAYNTNYIINIVLLL